ncbi:MAG TPA: MEDS domain-containing protein [Chryseolinea sp.]
MTDYSTLMHSPGSESRHQCLIYNGAPSQKLSLLARALQTKLVEGYRCLYLNSPPMVAGMRSTLASMDSDIAELVKDSLILSSDTVSSGKNFDSGVMLGKLEDLLDKAIKDGYKGLWASGDMTWEFGPSKDFSKLMEYELGLEEIFHRRKELCGICQYHHDTLPRDAMRQSLLIHPTVVINETLKIINPHYLKFKWPTDINTNQKLDKMLAELCKQ